MRDDELAVFWRKKDKNGNTYLSGIINADALRGELNVRVFRNQGGKEGQPDIRVKLGTRPNEQPRRRGPVEEYERNHRDPYGDPGHENVHSEHDDEPLF